MKEGAGQRDALLKPPGKFPHGRVRPVTQAEKIEYGSDLFLEFRKGEKHAEKLQVLAHRQVAVKGSGMGNKSDSRLRTLGVAVDVRAIQ